MEFSYYIGLFTNFDFTFLQWVFAVILSNLILIGISAFISFRKIKTVPKVVCILSFLTSTLFVGGIVGFINTVATFFITFSLLSDFRKDY